MLYVLVWRFQPLDMSRSPSSIGYANHRQSQFHSYQMLTRNAVRLPARLIRCLILTNTSQDIPNRKRRSATQRLSPLQAPGSACLSLSKARHTPKSRPNQDRQSAREHRLHRPNPSHTYTAAEHLVVRQMPAIDRRANERALFVALSCGRHRWLPRRPQLGATDKMARHDTSGSSRARGAVRTLRCSGGAPHLCQSPYAYCKKAVSLLGTQEPLLELTSVEGSSSIHAGNWREHFRYD